MITHSVNILMMTTINIKDIDRQQEETKLDENINLGLKHKKKIQSH